MSALLADGQPRTITVPNGDAQVLAGQIPQVGRFVVESVVAQIDASGSGDVTPELTILDPSGVVIATKQQTKPVAGGTTGTATWALRLTDDQPTPAPAAGGIEFTAHGVYGPVNTGDALDVETTVGDQTFDAHVHNIVLTGGRNGAGRQGRILVSPTVQILGGDATNLGTNQAELDVGTITETDIVGFAHDYLWNLGGANTGHASGDFKVLDHHRAPVLFLRDAGGLNQLGVFNVGPVAQQTVNGSRGGNAALASLLTALANYGFIIDNTTP